MVTRRSFIKLAGALPIIGISNAEALEKTSHKVTVDGIQPGSTIMIYDDNQKYFCDYVDDTSVTVSVPNGTIVSMIMRNPGLLPFIQRNTVISNDTSFWVVNKTDHIF